MCACGSASLDAVLVCPASGRAIRAHARIVGAYKENVVKVRRPIVAGILCGTLALLFVPLRAWQAAAPATATVTVERSVEARMRDGVLLRADVYRPDRPGRLPALLQRTPYSKRPEREDNAFRRLAAQGFVVVVQDTRGRYTSDGVARPHDEAEDGYDTVEWVASLPYVNGRVGTFGGSYSATTQLLTAPLRPPHLVAMFPSASYASRYDMVFQGGAFYLADGLSWNLGQGAGVRRKRLTPDANQDRAIGLDDTQRRLLRDSWLWHVPLKTMDAMELRRDAPGYFEMLDHPAYDAYWRTFDVAARHGEIDVPALHMTGWYDTLLNGTLANFAGLRKSARSAKARDAQRLVVGPWTHARPSGGTTKFGEVDFGPHASYDSESVLIAWFKTWLDGAPPSGAWAPPVRLFVMGENVWRDEQEWPLSRAVPTPFHLQSGGGANTLTGDGRLRVSAAGAASDTGSNGADATADRFVYDPWTPVPTGASAGYSRLPTDQRAIEARADVLVYTTDPLDRAIEVTGPIALHLWVSSSAPSTDFTAKLVDVRPDGTAIALTDGIRRVATGAPGTSATPGEIVIDLGATSNLFRVGHRIRLEVSSSNFPRFDRNPNTGAPFGESGELRRAEQTILHDAAHSSRLILPVIPRSQ